MTQLTAPNRTIDAANGVQFAHRRFGNADTPNLPLVFFQHFRGNIDNWDPALVDPIAEHREVILFDNVGVGGSSGVTPRTVTEMADGALAFIDALGLERIDVLAFSLGGYVAQEAMLTRPRLTRRAVLGGTGPQGGQDMHGFTDDVYGAAAADEPGAAEMLSIFFTPSATSVAKGQEFLGRIYARTDGRDTATSLQTRDAQLDAISAWGVPDASRLNRLAGIEQPVLVANGDHDVMVPTKNTRLLFESLPQAEIKIFADAGHGFLFQYPGEFSADVHDFLSVTGE